MSDEKQKADESAEQILMPANNRIKFLDHTIGMRPVPVAVAKDVRRLVDKLAKLMEEARTTEAIEKYSEMDEVAADLYIDTVCRLLRFYKVEITRDEIVDQASLPELKSFIEQQQIIQGTEDFLFRPLWNITGVFFPKKSEETTPPPEQNS